MEYKVEEITDFMKSWAREDYQESWDNSGIQINFNEVTENVTLALDLTDKVIDEAVKNNSKLIITHHPMFFSGIKNIDINTYSGKNIIKLIDNRISVYSAHTSLDIAKDGVNDTLCDILDLKVIKGLSEADSGYTIGNIAEFNEEISAEELLELLKNKLEYDNVKIYGRKNKIKKIAICGGSGASMIDDVINNNVNCYITGDVKHHDAQYAYEKGIMLVDISHYYGERTVLDIIKNKLQNNFKINVNIVNNNDFEVSLEK